MDLGIFCAVFKALCAIKCLYPNDELFIHHYGISQGFIQKVGFIGGVINANEVAKNKRKQNASI
ncbi:hypothetical protein ACWIWK_03200 [Helicobacter sp. 23-1048]